MLNSNRLYTSLVILGLFAFAPVVHADPISVFSLSGSNDDWTATRTGAIVKIVYTTGESSVTRINGVPIDPDPPAKFVTLEIDSTSEVDLGGGDFAYSIAVSSNPFETLEFSDGDVTFNLLTGSAILDVDDSGVLVLKGTKELHSDDSDTYDFSPFEEGGIFRFTLNADTGSFSSLLQGTGTTAGGSGSWSEVVPEPASLAMLGLGGLLAGAYGYRRRRSAC